MRGKKGQFFLLAAVIIAAVVISLGVGTNRATVNEDPASFYDFSYEVQREVGAVLDYEVYSGIGNNEDLEEFVDLLAKEIEERSPGSEFILIYGSRDDMKLRNYGSNSVYVEGDELIGFSYDALGKICLGRSCQWIDADLRNFDGEGAWPDNDIIDLNNILIEVEGTKFIFPLSDYRQVIFIMQKNIGGDRHVVVS